MFKHWTIKPHHMVLRRTSNGAVCVNTEENLILFFRKTKPKRYNMLFSLAKKVKGTPGFLAVFALHTLNQKTRGVWIEQWIISGCGMFNTVKHEPAIHPRSQGLFPTPPPKRGRGREKALGTRMPAIALTRNAWKVSWCIFHGVRFSFYPHQLSVDIIHYFYSSRRRRSTLVLTGTSTPLGLGRAERENVYTCDRFDCYHFQDNWGWSTYHGKFKESCFV